MNNFPAAFAALALAGLAEAVPPAPFITGGASNTKELSFAWQAIPQATRFELWFRATPGSAWGKYTEAPAGSTQIRINVSVHLLDWRVARYHVKSCDPSGCGTSNEIGVTGEALASIGYLKPNSAGNHRGFGKGVGVSADGRTLAVMTGETIGPRVDSAAIHVYRKTTSTSGWRREARLLPDAVQSGTAASYMSSPVALSADGNVLVAGLYAEDALGSNTPEDTGAVYLFRRSGTTWRLAQKLPGELHYQDRFGINVDLDDSGRTLVVSHSSPQGRSESGTLEIYRDPADSSDQFVHETTVLVPQHHTPSRGFCQSASLSGDGNTLFRTCEISSRRYVHVLNAPDWSQSAAILAGSNSGIDTTYDGRRFLVENSGHAIVFDLTASGWVQANGFIHTYDGHTGPQLAISRDGKIIAGGSFRGSIAGVGPVYAPYTTDSPPVGHVTIYELKAQGWSLRRAIKPGSLNLQSFGHSVALGDNGRILAVGAPDDPSAAVGIDGDRDDASAPARGAVWLY
jgi:hypothetical protein